MHSLPISPLSSLSAKPKNSAAPVVVQASTSGEPVVVAQCEAADSKPAATIKWMGAVGGTENTTSKKGPDGTVTVRSDYRIVPTPEDNGKEVTCIISQRTQDKPQTFPMKLAVECKRERLGFETHAPRMLTL